jgi:hypothetical protein
VTDWQRHTGVSEVWAAVSAKAEFFLTSGDFTWKLQNSRKQEKLCPWGNRTRKVRKKQMGGVKNYMRQSLHMRSDDRSS